MTDQVCLTITVNDVPEAPVVTGAATSCIAGIETYCVTTDPNATDYIWTVTGGDILSGQGTECVDVEWTTEGLGSICAIANNDCGASLENCLEVDVVGQPVPGAIITDTEVCECDIVTAQADYTGAVSCVWIVPQGATIVAGQGTDNVEIEWCGLTGTVDLCVTINYDCGSADVCVPVTINEGPQADAGSNGAICGLTYPLEANASVGTGIWTVFSGGTATFVDPTDPTTDVTADDFGTYVFTWTEDNNGCTSADDVEISFNESPSIDGAISETCNINQTDYVVEFTVTGGAAPYTIDGITGTFDGSGTVFTSDEIPSGDAYTFTITDANGCISIEYNGSTTCNCATDAGTMVLDQLEACIDEAIQGQHNGDEVLDGNDITQYILHDGDPVNGTIFDMNNTGLFNLVAPMTAENRLLHLFRSW